MKVLAVMDGTGTGGAETSMAAMAPLLGDHGIELEVAFFHNRPGARERFLEAGVPLHHIIPGQTRLQTVWRLLKVMKQTQPDLVHTMVFEADIIGRSAATFARLPVVSSIINEMYGPEQLALAPHPWKIRLSQLADIVTAKKVSRFHAISHTVAGVMAPRLRVGSRPISVGYRGRDLEVFAPLDHDRRSARRAEMGFSEHDELILALARQEPQKGLIDLVEAFANVVAKRPTAKLLLAGREGSETARLRATVQQCGLANSVHFLGHRGDAHVLLGVADVFAFPSHWEGLGGSVIEALATECPVVCSDLPVLREITRDEHGRDLALRFAPGDTRAAAEALIAVLDDTKASTARAELGRRHIAADFSLGRVSAEVAELFSRTMTKSHPRSNGVPERTRP